MERTAVTRLFRPITVTGFILAAAGSLAGCGGGAASTGSTGPSTASPTDTLGSDVPGSALVVTRSGGIAGVHDTVEIAADGTAQVTTRLGTTRVCTPDPAALAKLRAIDLAAVGTAPPKTPIADGFMYTVMSANGSASAGDGDTSGLHAELLAAAAAVVSSCMSSATDASAPTQ